MGLGHLQSEDAVISRLGLPGNRMTEYAGYSSHACVHIANISVLREEEFILPHGLKVYITTEVKFRQ